MRGRKLIKFVGHANVSLVSSRRLMNSPIVRAMSTRESVDAVQKLKTAVESYRASHFPEELPSRCRKHIICAADAESFQTGDISTNGLHKVLDNIGVSNQVTKEDVMLIISTHGAREAHSEITIPVNDMLDILS